MIMNTGRIRDQWHTMTRTGLARQLFQHRAEPFVELHPRDARDYGIEQHQLVQLSNPALPEGSYTGRARITDSQRPGELFVPMHWTRQFAGDGNMGSLIEPVTDPLSGQPESKHACVAIVPQKVAYYGTVLTSDTLRTDLFDHWCRVGSDGGERYEVALFETVALPSLCQQLVGVNGKATG